MISPLRSAGSNCASSPFSSAGCRSGNAARQAKFDGLATSCAKRECLDVERCGGLTVTEVGHDGGQISPRDHVEQFLLVDRKMRPNLLQVVDCVTVRNDRVMAGALEFLVMETAACALSDNRGIGHGDCAERLARLQARRRSSGHPMSSSLGDNAPRRGDR